MHKEIKKAIAGLSVEALDWVPAGNTNSINVLVTHLAAAEQYWGADVPLGRESDRVREEEFEAGGMSESELVQLLDDTLEIVRAGFEDLTLSDLEVVRHAKKQNMDITAGWAILHALEHTAQHLGHIQMTVQLWEE
jgi:uncharacterized damage-inducible protein DinB